MNTQTQPNSAETFEGFAIVELMGRNVIAGYCTEEVIAGIAMLRVDVPAMEDRPGFTKRFSGAAIYAITATNEETAKIAATRLRTRPVDLWIVPNRPALPAPMTQGGEYDQADDDYDGQDFDDDDDDGGGDND